MDPYLSLVSVMGVGYLGGALADGLRAPRVVVMILLGAALAPALSPSVLSACSSDASSVSPAAAMRSFALLVALARGGLTMSLGSLRALWCPLAALAALPYACEAAAAFGSTPGGTAAPQLAGTAHEFDRVLGLGAAAAAPGSRGKRRRWGGSAYR